MLLCNMILWENDGEMWPPLGVKCNGHSISKAGFLKEKER